MKCQNINFIKKFQIFVPFFDFPLLYIVKGVKKYEKRRVRWNIPFKSIVSKDIN